MQTEEKVLLGLAAVALVAIVVFKLTPGLAANVGVQPGPSVVGESMTPGNTAVDDVPFYLGFNMPYRFGLPPSFVVPGITEGQVGQTDVATIENGDSGFLPPNRQWSGV